jgi:peptide methionine sulfoxide reductase MsrA
LLYSPLLGETSKQLLSQYYINPTSLISVILIDNGQAYTHSSSTFPVNDEQAADVSKLIEKLKQDEDEQKMLHNMG